MSGRKFQIAVIPGDGIGPELIEGALAVLDAVGRKCSLELAVIRVDAGADVFRRTGAALSAEDFEIIRCSDSTLKGPVGLPDVRHADGTEAGVLGGVLRTGLDLYANVRPIKLLPGVASALRDTSRGIDYVIVRENTEGMYAARGRGVGTRWAVADTMLVTRYACERISRHAFELALRRSAEPTDRVRRVTCVDKANVLRSLGLFRDVFLEVAEKYPSVQAEWMHVDAAAQALVMEPERFDVIVTENLFGDILSDLGGGTVGGIAMCPSGNIGESGAYFEPIHGSAPSLARKNLANPFGQILASAMMLDFLGEGAAADVIRAAVAAVLKTGSVEVYANGSVRGGAMAVAERIVDYIDH